MPLLLAKRLLGLQYNVLGNISFGKKTTCLNKICSLTRQPGGGWWGGIDFVSLLPVRQEKSGTKKHVPPSEFPFFYLKAICVFKYWLSKTLHISFLFYLITFLKSNLTNLHYLFFCGLQFDTFQPSYFLLLIFFPFSLFLH